MSLFLYTWHLEGTRRGRSSGSGWDSGRRVGGIVGGSGVVECLGVGFGVGVHFDRLSALKPSLGILNLPDLFKLLSL